MIMHHKILTVISCLLLLPLWGISQQFHYKASLQNIDKTGFYSIDISPEISSYIQPGFIDIRIADNKGNWVPHILESDLPNITKQPYTNLLLVQNTLTDSGRNLIIIENKNADGLKNFYLFLKNAAVSRLAKLSGSNDRKDWFIIDDKLIVNRSNETLKDEYLQQISFPLAKYRYLRLVIDNDHDDPLHITRAGYFQNLVSNSTPVYYTNPAPEFFQVDSNKHSYIKVQQTKKYIFDKISLSIKAPRYYSREAEIRVAQSNKNGEIKPSELISRKSLQSGTKSEFEPTQTNAEIFFIIINNGDSPPLIIDSIVTKQQSVSLIAYLEKHKHYELQFGDSNATAPNYDLQAFKDSISTLNRVSVGPVSKIENAKATGNSENKKSWIWPSIIVALLVLSYLTFRLVADINKPKK